MKKDTVTSLIAKIVNKTLSIPGARFEIWCDRDGDKRCGYYYYDGEVTYISRNGYDYWSQGCDVTAGNLRYMLEHMGDKS